MRRILLLITDLEIGGTPTVVRELALRLRNDDVRVDVACLKGFGPVATQLTKAGVHVKGFSASSVIDLPSVVGELRQHVVDRQIDTVVSFLVHPNAIAALASRKLPGVRWIQSIQTTQPTPRWHWFAQRIAQFAAEKVVVPSPSVAQVAQDWADVPERKIVIIPNAIDLPRPSGTGYQPVDHGLVAHATNRVGFIGRLDPVKRIPDLLAAVAKLPAVSLDLWGEGSYRPVVEATIARLGLADRVKLHGAIASPHEALQQMDVLVLPSEAEGFGLVLIEAMAAGVPVVATNVAGIRDVVRDQQTGLLVPARDPAALAHAIEQVLSDSSLRSRLTEAGRREVQAKYTWDRVLPIYRLLLGIA
jgi:glycosyltransferase involved in cell wall biosynthesis